MWRLRQPRRESENHRFFLILWRTGQEQHLSTGGFLTTLKRQNQSGKLAATGESPIRAGGEEQLTATILLAGCNARMF
jgi:hypothetical protein